MNGVLMGNVGHFKKVCERCGTIMNQCRCTAQDKAIEYGICSKCLRDKTTGMDNVKEGDK